MATLYEMTAEVAELYEALQDAPLDDETAQQVLTDHIEGIGADKKVEAYCQIIKQLAADSEMYAAEIRRLSARRKTAENAAERLKKTLAEFLTASGQRKLQGGTFTVSLRSNAAVNILDETAIPSMYLIAPPPKVDKAAIKKVFAAGGAVAGCELTENTGVMIK
ncbi:MAG: siphovirus Gp157 family protein [Eubacterium sp.]|nr:siphovirus Gp157 family protein [Eubacterium sp.]